MIKRFSVEPPNATCPLCGDEQATRKHLLNRRDLDNAQYEIFLCPSCDLLYAVGPSDAELIGQIYSNAFYNSGQQTAPHNQDGSLKPEAMTWPVVANSRARVQWLVEKGARGRLLDIGAGRGYFVHCAREAFDAIGIELQESAVAFAQGFGARVLRADLMSTDLPAESFDVVTLWDVFAGFPEPGQAVDSILRLLKPGGLLVFTVPDAMSLVARTLGSRWPLLIPPGNLRFYSRRSVNRLLTRPDIRSFESLHQAKWVSVPFLIRKLMQAIDLHVLANRRFPIPSTWKIPLNAGDILTVAATKD